MRAFPIKLLMVALSNTLFLPDLLFGAGGGDVTKLVLVADTRGLNGVTAWLANLYNESHVYFTVFTVICIPVVGLILGLLADVVMRWIGIDLKSRKLSEH